MHQQDLEISHGLRQCCGSKLSRSLDIFWFLVSFVGGGGGACQACSSADPPFSCLTPHLGRVCFTWCSWVEGFFYLPSQKLTGTKMETNALTTLQQWLRALLFECKGFHTSTHNDEPLPIPVISPERHTAFLVIKPRLSKWCFGGFFLRDCGDCVVFEIRREIATSH